MQTIQNKQIVMTQNNNCIITYSINIYEIVTLNYYENTILVNIYDDECNIICICTFESVHDRYNYTILNNIRNINTELLDEIMQQLNEQILNLQY